MKHALLLTLTATSLFVEAQHGYVIELDTQPYVELTSPTPCTFVDGFHQITELADETFRFFNNDFVLDGDPQAFIGDYGHLQFDAPAGSIIIDGLFAYLTPIDATTGISYSVTGAPGSRMLVAQWRNWELTNGPDGNYANWQIAVEQATGIIEIRFGPNSGGEDLYMDEDGPHCGIFWSNNAFTACYARLWFEQDTAEPYIDTVPNFHFNSLHEPPAPNTVYRLTPAQHIGIAEAGMRPMLSARVVDNTLDILLPQGSTQGAVRIVDASGRDILERVVNGPRARIGLNGLACGSYVAVFTSDKGGWYSRFVLDQ